MNFEFTRDLFEFLPRMVARRAPGQIDEGCEPSPHALGMVI